jgi:hypothetical protein
MDYFIIAELGNGLKIALFQKVSFLEFPAGWVVVFLLLLLLLFSKISKHFETASLKYSLDCVLLENFSRNSK